jgi:hypothetical protein
MTKEQELLGQLSLMWDNNISLPLDDGIAFERELAKLYMPQIDSSATDEELLAWGTQFKSTIKQKLEMFRNGQIG